MNTNTESTTAKPAAVYVTECLSGIIGDLTTIIQAKDAALERLRSVEFAWNDCAKHLVRANELAKNHLGKNVVEGLCDQIEMLQAEIAEARAETSNLASNLRGRIVELEQELEKAQTVTRASRLCGAHIGIERSGCPICRVEELERIQELCKRALLSITNTGYDENLVEKAKKAIAYDDFRSEP